MKYLPKNFRPKKNYDLIRVGRNNDGGYLCGKKSILNSKNLISFGICDDISFEKNFKNINNKCTIFMFDKYVDNIFWLKIIWKNLGLSIFNLNPFYILKSIIRWCEFIHFKKKNFFYKKEIDFKSIKKYLKKKNTFLKVDIEGSEYRILDEIISEQKKIIALVIEFHDVDLNLSKIYQFIKKINLTLTHIHPNNGGGANYYKMPKIIEFTFEKFPLIKKGKNKLPNKYDQKNLNNLQDLKLFFK